MTMIFFRRLGGILMVAGGLSLIACTTRAASAAMPHWVRAIWMGLSLAAIIIGFIALAAAALLGQLDLLRRDVSALLLAFTHAHVAPRKNKPSPSTGVDRQFGAYLTAREDLRRERDDRGA